MSIIGQCSEFDPNHSDWTVYRKRLGHFFKANAIADAPRKHAVLLNAMSESAYKLIADLTVPSSPEDKTYDEIISLLDTHFTPQRSVFAERYKFYSAMKDKHETMAEWCARVKHLATHCEFGAVLQVVLRDRFLMGLPNGRIKEKLFLEAHTITLQEMLKKGQTLETSQNCAAAEADTSVLERIKREPADVYRVGTSRAKQPKHFGGTRKGSSTPTVSNMATSATPVAHGGSTSTSHKQKCFVCGWKNHRGTECRYKNFTCNSCGKVGHLKNMCSEKNKNSNRGSQNSKNCYLVEDHEEMSGIFNIRVIDNKPITVTVALNKVPVEMQIDTGAAVSVISDNMYDCYFNNIQLSQTDVNLVGYTGKQINSVGYMTVDVVYNNKINKINVYVIKDGGPALLGRDFLEKFNMVIKDLNFVNANNVNALCNQYKDIFSETLGTFTKGIIELKCKQDIKPKFWKPRTLPFALKDKVEQELERLVKLNILTPVDSSPWGTPIVPVIKTDGSVRICGDYKITVNPMLELDRYPLPRIEELFYKLQGGKHFSKIDLSHAYQQVLLHENSRQLTTISTHKGLFMYNRLPFGINSAPSKFQRIMESILQGIPGVACFIDDIIVTGHDTHDHMKNLESVFKCLLKCGLHVKLEKCCFFQESVTYLGFVIDKEGLHPSNEKIKAIINAPEPTNKTQLKSFLGLINYYRKFVGNITEILHPFYNLLKGDSEWVWDEHCELVFKRIKEVLTSSEVLVHFDPNVKIKLTVDASDYGLGAILSHLYENGTERPICYASRILTKTESKYSQIDKEALAIKFGVIKFHQYLYGRHFILATDNKPLLAIFGSKKGIPVMAANRLQRYAILLSAYSFDIEYVNTKKNASDFLSRLPLNVEINSIEEYTYLNYVKSNENIVINEKQIVTETQNDTILKQVYNFVLNGWPENIKSTEIKPYFRKRNELTVEKDILMWGYRVIVPDSLRKTILDELHSSHMGIVKMKSLARCYVWWPGMDLDLEKICKTCSSCLRHRDSPDKSTLIPWKYPEEPWERIHLDFFELFNRMFLVVIDSFSKWIEVIPMKNTNSLSTINVLRELFSRFGLPKTVVSDNGRQFVSYEFEAFLSNNGIRHTTCAPYRPATNGAAENVVKTVKNHLLRGLNEKISDNEIFIKLQRFLLMYRNTVHCTTGETPAKLLLGRKCRMLLDLLRPSDTKISDVDYSKTRNFVKNKQQIQVENYGGRRKEMFVNNQKIMTRVYKANDSYWSPGEIVKVLGHRTYLVKLLENNKIVKRHIDQIISRNYVEDDCESLISLPIEIPETVTQEITENSVGNGERPIRNRKPPDRYTPT